MVFAAILPAAIRVEAFRATTGTLGIRVLNVRREGLSSRPAAAAAEPTLRPQQQGVDTKPTAVSETRRAKDEANPRGFFERLGCPRYIAAPMVEHSEAVRELAFASKYLYLCLACDNNSINSCFLDYSMQAPEGVAHSMPTTQVWPAATRQPKNISFRHPPLPLSCLDPNIYDRLFVIWFDVTELI